MPLAVIIIVLLFAWYYVHCVNTDNILAQSQFRGEQLFIEGGGALFILFFHQCKMFHFFSPSIISIFFLFSLFFFFFMLIHFFSFLYFTCNAYHTTSWASAISSLFVADKSFHCISLSC